MLGYAKSCCIFVKSSDRGGAQPTTPIPEAPRVMAQSSSFFITTQYGDSAPQTVSNFLTANGAEMQLVGLTKHNGYAALTPKEARCAVAEAAALDGSGCFSFHWGKYHMTVHRH